MWVCLKNTVLAIACIGQRRAPMITRNSPNTSGNNTFDEMMGRYKKETCRTKFENLLSSIFLPAFGLFIVSVSMVIIFFQESNMNYNNHGLTLSSNNNKYVVTLISEICEVILASIISILSVISLCNVLKKLRNSTQARQDAEPFQRKFKIDFTFLLIAFIFLVLYCGITLVGALMYAPAGTLTKVIMGFTIIASVIPVPQTIIQIVVIYKIYKNKIFLSEYITDMWIILSFAVWLFDTFSAKGYDTNEIQIAFYKQFWDILNPIFIPMSIFFRFHSCIVFANIKGKAYWKPEGVRVRMK
jgi:hypothetical protein